MTSCGPISIADLGGSNSAAVGWGFMSQSMVTTHLRGFH
jgi:hypothetical protein